ncbi:MAG TPA: DNA polymerase III subunit gamma/tau, partial [Verrucomicrobiae bacterium]|nr:DNA polymerase III subunit gamma/tau [Verrucomicrobiae bacterium]
APGTTDLLELWHRLVEAVGRASPFVRTYLLEAHPVSLTKHLLTIGFDPEFEDHISLVDHARNHTLLQTKLSELGHPNMQIKFVKAERPENWAKPAPTTVAPEPAKVATAPSPAVPAKMATAAAAPPMKEKPVSVAFDKNDFKNDPLIQKALEVFKGQIVDVRA